MDFNKASNIDNNNQLIIKKGTNVHNEYEHLTKVY